MEKISYPKNIQIFFKEVVNLIKENLNPEFIILAGSFAKGSWLYNKNELISDIEIIFICNKKWPISIKNKLVEILNKKYPYKIELKGFVKSKIEKKILSNYAVKNPGFINLNFFDTFNEPQYLYNKEDSFLNITTSVDEIPDWEAWRLYVNRMGDVLKVDCTPGIDLQTADYYWLKIFESTADAYCIVNNIYYKNISKRLIIFNKELIDTDKELPDICKDSFSVIQKALQAREHHDLSIFDIDLTSFQRKEIIKAWMEYFERKMAKQENIIYDKKPGFYDNYLLNKSLQNKYLDFSNGLNIILTNSMKWIKNLKKLRYPFKFYVQNYSWRHIILLSVSSAFYEQSMGNNDFRGTKKIAGKIINRKKVDNLKNGDFVQCILSYWKVIR